MDNYNIALTVGGNVVASDELESIICAANVAGYMEREDRIDVPSDTDLMKSIVKHYNEWLSSEAISWMEYIEAKLLEDFGPTVMYVLVKKNYQQDFTDHFGEEAEPFSEIIGIYATSDAAEKEKFVLESAADPFGEHSDEERGFLYEIQEHIVNE